jgi:hypothetical protein
MSAFQPAGDVNRACQQVNTRGDDRMFVMDADMHVCDGS